MSWLKCGLHDNFWENSVTFWKSYGPILGASICWGHSVLQTLTVVADILKDLSKPSRGRYMEILNRKFVIICNFQFIIPPVFTLSIHPPGCLPICDILKRQWWNFIKLCKHIDIHKMNIYNRKRWAWDQYCYESLPFVLSLISWKGNDGNSPNFANTKLTFIIEKYGIGTNSIRVIAFCNS